MYVKAEGYCYFLMVYMKIEYPEYSQKEVTDFVLKQ